jgi:hypothetical protein
VVLLHHARTHEQIKLQMFESAAWGEAAAMHGLSTSMAREANCSTPGAM